MKLQIAGWIGDNAPYEMAMANGCDRIMLVYPLENTDHDIKINVYVSLINGTTLLLMLILGVYDKFSATFSVYDINSTILLLGILIYLSS